MSRLVVRNIIMQINKKSDKNQYFEYGFHGNKLLTVTGKISKWKYSLFALNNLRFNYLILAVLCQFKILINELFKYRSLLNNVRCLKSVIFNIN